MIDISNVSDQFAFDVVATPISLGVIQASGATIHRLTFYVESLARGEQITQLGFRISPEMPLLRNYQTRADAQICESLHTSLDSAFGHASAQTVDPNAPIGLATVKIRFRNIQGRVFSQDFAITVAGGNTIEAIPDGSLIRQDIDLLN